MATQMVLDALEMARWARGARLEGLVAHADAVNSLFKTEFIRGPRQGPWRTVDDVELATLGWVYWWNTRRIHGYLGDLSPDQFEAAYAARHTDQENLNIQPAQNSEAASHLAMALVVIAT